MADTQRTKTDLIDNIFPDGQANGSITAQDMRDLIESVTPSIGSMYFSTPSATTISVATTEYKAAGTTTLESGSGHRFSMPVDNRLIYTGTATNDCLINVSFSATVDGNNQDLRFMIYQNGAKDAGSEVSRTWGTGTDVGSASISFYKHMDTNDYVELYIANDTGTNDITITKCMFSILGFSAN